MFLRGHPAGQPPYLNNLMAKSSYRRHPSGLPSTNLPFGPPVRSLIPLPVAIALIVVASVGMVAIALHSFRADVHPGKAWIAEPRHDLPGWTDTHETYVTEAADLMAYQDGELDLLFLGDSITEAWRERDRGSFCFNERCKGLQDLWKRNFGHLEASALGIGGDRTEHLLWRVKNGEMRKLQPKVVVLLIGTNNLGWAMKQSPSSLDRAVHPTAKGVKAVVSLVRSELPAHTHLVVLAILPRGDRSWDQPEDEAQASRFVSHALPSAFSNATREVNRRVKQWVARTARGRRTAFLDCGHTLLNQDQTAIQKELMEDALHPTAEGYEV